MDFARRLMLKEYATLNTILSFSAVWRTGPKISNVGNF